MNNIERGTTPVDDEEETEEETGSKIQPNPEEIKRIDSSPEDQKEIDDWVNKHGGKR